MSNLLRNNYYNFARPCLKCPLQAAEPNNLCKIYGEQGPLCPFFEKWQKGKQNAFDVKLPVSLEHHSQEVFDKPQETFDLEGSSDRLHSKMLSLLKPAELRVYKMLFIHHLKESEVAKKMGFKRDPAKKSERYKQLENIKKIIMAKVKKVLFSDEVDIV